MIYFFSATWYTKALTGLFTKTVFPSLKEKVSMLLMLHWEQCNETNAVLLAAVRPKHVHWIARGMSPLF